MLDVVKYARLLLFDPGGEKPRLRASIHRVLTRLRLHLDTGQLRETVIDDATVEFQSAILAMHRDIAMAGWRHVWALPSQTGF